MKNIIIIVLAISIITPLSAGDTFESFQVQLENDSIGFHPNRSDQHYTQGLRLSWFYKPNRQPELFNTVGNKLSEYFKTRADIASYGFAIGQNFFTPNDISEEELNLNDRPYAGILYGSALFYMPKYSADERFELSSHQTDFTLGVIGPSSLSKRVQIEWHEIVNATDPRGWDNQLEDEPVFNINYQYRKKVTSDRQKQKESNQLAWDINPHAGFSLGTITTGLHAGVAFRFGENLKYLGGGLIKFTGVKLVKPRTNGAAAVAVPPAENSDNNGWNVALSLTGHAVFHNIFLDGNVFRDSIHSVDNETFVYDSRISFNIRNTKLLFWEIGDYEVGLDMVRRSKEFEGQTPDSQYFSGFRFKKYFQD